MILSFSVSNFRSFNEEETISFVASKRLAGTHDDHLVPIPNTHEHVLRCALLYGANGGGKSNLYRALHYLTWLATEPRSRNTGTGREAFRFSGQSSRPSTFDLHFVASGRVFRYGLEVVDDRISEEWLTYKKGEREFVVFERRTDQTGSVMVKLGSMAEKHEKLAALATVGGPPHQSFLATVAVNLGMDSAGTEVGTALRWMDGGLTLISPGSRFGPLGHVLESNDKFRDFAGEFLRLASTGVDRLETEKREISETELRQFFGERQTEELLGQLRDEAEESAIVSLPGRGDIVVERVAGKLVISEFRIQTTHQTDQGPTRLDLADESDGTQRLLHLLPALYPRNGSGKVYFIDEIDRSLHPILAREFLDAFLKSAGTGSQLIVTTHESSLLDQDLLRRDEVWFVEKDQNQASRLYSLADFKVRKDLELRKHYLQGRFGAVPFIGDLAGSVLSAAEEK